MYLIGYDIGSSSIKAALIEAKSGKTLDLVQHPSQEMNIISKQTGWAEQEPELWWESVCIATKMLLKNTQIDPNKITSIGIAYQMHGLVVVDENQEVLRPSIIWCDSRAVEIGNDAFENIGPEKCLATYLNSPGNFTASKLKWVKENEPERYSKIHKIMLPGDFIAMKLTGKICTTPSGLSEGVLWDFKNNSTADVLLNHYGISKNLIPDIVDTFSVQGQLTKKAAEATGLSTQTVVAYRAGDQPNNALSLGVHQPNEVAATCGTSGVIYGIADQYKYDPQSRVNSFAHVNHSPNAPRVGILLCINGAGIQYSWVKQQMALDGTTYDDMEKILSEIPIGSDGLRIIPFGNGAERMLSNKETGAQMNNLQFNRHTRAHSFRAAVEGVAFSFCYGFQLMRPLGLEPKVIKVGNDNLFQSATFSNTIANLLNCKIEVVNTTGAIGAAKASGVAPGIYTSLEGAFQQMEVIKTYQASEQRSAYQQAYELWHQDLKHLLNGKTNQDA